MLVARKAVERDRVRRGEPVGHLHSNGDFCQDRNVVPERWPVPLYAAPQPAAPCPHIRSSGTGEQTTNWCSLSGPPAAPVVDLLRELLACDGGPGASYDATRWLKVRAALVAAMGVRNG